MTRDPRVLVIGAGPSGIATAIALRAAGISDYLVVEKGDDVGGTWRENTYPGCGCDVPSHWYSYSFDPNPFWSRFYSPQPEILRYFRASARRHGVYDQIRFGVRVTGARWDATAHRWLVDTTDGRYTASVLAAAPGPLHEPTTPTLPGLKRFTGTAFHSARWNHDHDLTGRRVAVIGTGASAIQFVPEIVSKVAELHVFQRTPSWVLPKLDFPIPLAARMLFQRAPITERAVRFGIYAAHEAIGVAFRHERLMRRVQRLARLHLYAQVRSPELRAALTPRFTLGCKRILISNDYYPALSRPHVRVHPAAASVTPHAVVGTDGEAAEVDTVIFGTGFEVASPPVARYVFDGDGRSLASHWEGRPPSAYLGTTLAGFPNLFVFLGPNIAPGHASVLSTIEAQARYVADAVGAMARNGWTALRVRPEVHRRYNEAVASALEPTVYNAGGCTSYYLDGSGHNVANWPWSVARLSANLRFRSDDYEVSDRVRSPVEEVRA
ncbi:flavin-containing monooxygenase [Pseudonocardia acaciae]|uniref:flavin-containing monooxygenase n=1 Tax=Pseudonocardia acaciae TaxID=551276 RepID=UPI00048CC51E|nr:NAD(P)/FAD-dependent oxidoreductase [Pseudonocardia acaciae]